VGFPFVNTMEGVLVLQITPVERAVLQLLADGRTTTEIADRLRITERGVEALLTMLFGMMGASDRPEAVAAALRRGLLYADDSPRTAYERHTMRTACPGMI
jgi:DNA-binding CsgD family transcriptional regulator